MSDDTATVEQLAVKYAVAYYEKLGNCRPEWEALKSAIEQQARTIAELREDRDNHKIWWVRDSTALGTALNQVSHWRVIAEDFRALAATRASEIAEQAARLEALTDALDGALGVHLAYLTGNEPPDAAEILQNATEVLMGKVAAIDGAKT